MLYLSANMLDKLGLYESRVVSLAAGNKKTEAKIVAETSRDNSYYLQADLRARLHLSGIRQPLAFYFNKTSEELRIGPVIGILVSAPIPVLEEKNVSLFRKIVGKAFRDGIICYFFTPDLIDSQEQTTGGFIFRSNSDSRQEWVIQDFPMPDIIYNQVGIISRELRPLYGKVMKQYSGGMRTVNPFLALNDKLINYNNLQKCPPVKKYLPETVDGNNTAGLFYLLEKYQSVYLKPTASSRGFGVYKAEQAGKDEFIIQYHQADAEKKIKRLTRSQLTAMLETILKQQPYLAQQAVEVGYYQGRPPIFRVHIFKNDQGCWDIIYIAAKLGAVSGIVTGSLWGGYFAPADGILREIFPDVEPDVILQEIGRVALEIARAIENIHNREFGEMGFDLAVDTKKRIWMIEVNPKPNFLVAGIDKEEIEDNLAEHLLGCCRHLLHIKTDQPAIGFPVNK